MHKVKTPLWTIYLVGIEKDSTVDRNGKGHITKAYKYKVVIETILSRMQEHQQEDPEIRLKDLDPQDLRNRVQNKLEIYRTDNKEEIKKRQWKTEIENLIIREYYQSKKKHGMMKKISENYWIPYTIVREVINKYM